MKPITFAISAIFRKFEVTSLTGESPRVWMTFFQRSMDPGKPAPPSLSDVVLRIRVQSLWTPTSKSDASPEVGYTSIDAMKPKIGPVEKRLRSRIPNQRPPRSLRWIDNTVDLMTGSH